MQKRLVSNILVVIILISTILSGCSNNIEKKLIGTWILDTELSDIETDADMLTFYEGGSCINSGETGTWSVTNKTISIMGSFGGLFWDRDNLIGEFDVSKNMLVISNPAVDGNVEIGNLVYIKN